MASAAIGSTRSPCSLISSRSKSPPSRSSTSVTAHTRHPLDLCPKCPAAHASSMCFAPLKAT
eukprot:1874797-Rhodomonas_salina.1